MLKKFLFLLFAAAFGCVWALDYSQKSSWLICESGKKNSSYDVFYIYPTLLKDKNSACPDLKDLRVRTRLKKFSAAQAGIFDRSARIFVPAVRQLEFTRCGAALEQYKNGVIDARSPFFPGVEDTVRAFRYYFKHLNKGRPYILFGHSQGAMVLYELLKRVPEISPGRGFAAAYLPGLPGVTAGQIQKDLGKRGIMPAADEGSTGVVIVWNTRSGKGGKTPFAAPVFGINPVNWRTDDVLAPKSRHKGMILFDHRVLSPVLYMYRGAPVPACTARLTPGGILIAGELPPLAQKLYSGLFGEGCLHGGDVWLFAGNIAENVRLRTSLCAMKKELDKAVEMIRTGEAECVLLKKGRIAAAEKGRGVSPLLRLYDRDKQAMKGAVIVDKVIGRAAAAIAINGGARHVYGAIMSEDAKAFLKENGISSSCGLEVRRILNRSRSGLCPLEKSVEGITDPVQALKALRKKISLLMKGSPKK